LPRWEHLAPVVADERQPQWPTGEHMKAMVTADFVDADPDD